MHIRRILLTLLKQSATLLNLTDWNLEDSLRSSRTSELDDNCMKVFFTK